MSPIVVCVAGVSKSFRVLHDDRPFTLQEVFQRGRRGSRARETRTALDSVSFEVSRGEALGIVGANGAGKSTLLRMIGGLGRPDDGSIEVQGRVGCLLDLGTGFHPELTGRENVYINGVVSGLTYREVRQRFDSIVDFSELEPFIDNPIRTYSSGMQMRLAFAVAAHIDPEVLLIDEVLSVGDAAFQRKCLMRLKRFKTRGCTTIVVSHATNLVRDLCDTALWLDRGSTRALGPSESVTKAYEAAMAAPPAQST
ncbi:MAG: ABC transporter ATP-binding protein [Acidobacteriota bacterium]|nr:ABC transporter ATP-binding protein [Acidobacteriota bacterium]